MFKLASSFITSAFIIMAAAAPTADLLHARSTELSPNVQVCTGPSGTAGCLSVPVSSDSCENFSGGLSFLNKEVTSAVVPDGFVCGFFEQFGCISDQGGEDQVVVTGGTWDFFDVPSAAGIGNVDFNDLSSSFLCTPI